VSGRAQPVLDAQGAATHIEVMLADGGAASANSPQAVTCNSRRLFTLWRRKQRSSAEPETRAWPNSRVITSRSSSGNSSSRRNSTTMSSLRRRQRGAEACAAGDCGLPRCRGPAISPPSVRRCCSGGPALPGCPGRPGLCTDSRGCTRLRVNLAHIFDLGPGCTTPHLAHDLHCSVQRPAEDLPIVTWDLALKN
jgi:hypothetical protein